MLQRIKKTLYNSAQFNQAIKAIGRNHKTIIGGLKGASVSFFTDYLVTEDHNHIVIITSDHERAEEIWGDLTSISAGEDILYFPSRKESKQRISIPHEQIGLQLNTINQLLDGTPNKIVTTISAISEKIPGSGSLQSQRIVLETSQEYELEFLVEELVEFGYERTDLVSSVGEFSVRGGLIDVFAFESVCPVRIEFFGDVVDTIRIFDVTTQRSKEKIQRFSILPPPGKNNGQYAEAQNDLLDLLPEKTILLLDQPELFERVFIGLKKPMDRDESIQEWQEEEVDKQWEKIQEKFEKFKTILHPHLGSQDGVDIHFRMLGMNDYRGNIRELRKDINQFYGGKPAHVFVLLEEKFEVERMHDLLQEFEQNIHIGQAVLHSGFQYANEGIFVITEKDLFGRIPRKRNWGKYRGGTPISKLNTLSPSDLVVHVDHGIGRYTGLEKITVANAERECLKIRYRDGDLLFVHIDQLWRISKYSGAEGMVPKLSQLGGKDWEKIKERTRKAVEKMAKDLLQLYATRKTKEGFAFSTDSLWQKELEASFLYEETPDQLSTIEEVKKDMESRAPMDRLICGDVGFGKTEVALRAAFKAVLDGKQVAILVPTTVLAQQHYSTFCERLSRYPVEVGLLSRFKTTKEQKKEIEKLKSGKLDIVIGTHRLLSKDVEFKNLGLFIIDEEHRFGVKQKEKLKSIHKLVDVLSLSATPIPRTLYFSMAGSRDMSVINTPPDERLPVISQVLPFDKKIIKSAILEEIYRGGQVFLVHNAVRSIYSMENLILKLIPDIRIAVAHGQMSPHELEKVMTDFVEKKYDCLICTMIIESGLDLPNVNTLIVNRADKLGLAQLYQIKGRVGRSNRQAFAYFLVPPIKYLTPSALKRLQTIEEHFELGAGLQIAMKDLEIRGAGNLLGSDQSGFINVIGFDLYCKLLEESISNLKNEKIEVAENGHLKDVVIDVDFDAYIPDDYVSIDFERINIYQRLNISKSKDDLFELDEELRDRFGQLPKPVRTLLEITRLRQLCASLGIDKFKIRNRTLTAYFSDSYYTKAKQKSLQQILSLIQASSPEKLQFLHGKKFGFKFQLRSTDETSLNDTKEFFKRLEQNTV